MKIRIEVGEPRNFDAGGGSNVIIGEIDPSLSGSHTIAQDPTIATLIQTPKGENVKPEAITEYWFVVNCPAVNFEGMSFKSILVTPRYKTKTPPEETLKKGDDLVVNGIWRQDKGVWDAQSIAAAQEGNIEIEGMIVGLAKEEKN